jgi:hypothetical protein
MNTIFVTHSTRIVDVYGKDKINDITDFKFESGEVRRLTGFPTNGDFNSVFEKLFSITNETKPVEFTDSEIDAIKKYTNVYVESEEQEILTLKLDTSKYFKGLKGEKCYGNQSQGHLTYNTVKRQFSIEGGTGMLKKGDKLQILMPENGNEIKVSRMLLFEITRVDSDGEDIAGWHGVQVNGQKHSTIFILND